MNNLPYKKIHVVINPTTGKDEPILNVINDVFQQYEVDWSIVEKDMKARKNGPGNGVDDLPQGRPLHIRRNDERNSH